MRKVSKRILCASLALMMVLSLGGCKLFGGGQNNGQNGHNGGGSAITEDLSNPEAASEHVYQEVARWALGWDGMQQISVCQDNIAALYQEYEYCENTLEELENANADDPEAPANEEEENAEDADAEAVKEPETEEPEEAVEPGDSEDVVDVDTPGEEAKVTEHIAVGKVGDAEPTIIDIEGKMNENAYRIAATDNSVVVLYSSYTEADNGDYSEDYFLVEYDLNGNEIARGDIASNNSTSETYFYPGNFVYGNGGFVLNSDGVIYVFDRSLVKKGEIPLDDVYVEKLIRNKDGEVIAITSKYTDAGMEYAYKTIDINAAKFGADANFTSAGNFNVYNANGSAMAAYTAECYDGINLTGYSADKAEGEVICSLIDSDISPSRIDYMGTVSEDQIVTSEHDDNYSDYAVVFYKKVPADQVAAKEIITLGCVYPDYAVLNKVVDYNKASSQYRIRVVNYSQLNTDDDFEAGSRAFDADIISGNAPDMVILDWGSNPEKYSSKGLFVDLNTLLDTNSNISSSDILPNIVDINTYDGKLYTLPMSFTISTYVMNGEDAPSDGLLSIDEVKALESQYGCKAFFNTAAPYVLNTILSNSRKKFMDPVAGTCNFDNPEFVEILEYVSQYPKSYDDINTEEIDYTEYQNAYRAHNALMTNFTISDLSYINNSIRYNFDEGYKFVSAPGAEQRGTISMASVMAITNTCSHPEGAWDFLSSFLSKEAQDEFSYGLPIRMDSLDTKLQEMKKGPYYMDGDKKVYYQDTVYVNGEEIKLDPLNDAQIQDLKDLILSINQISYFDEDIDNIITEEVSAYLAGQKSAQEVASIIQSRVQIYINEHK